MPRSGHDREGDSGVQSSIAKWRRFDPTLSGCAARSVGPVECLSPSVWVKVFAFHDESVPASNGAELVRLMPKIALYDLPIEPIRPLPAKRVFCESFWNT